MYKKVLIFIPTRNTATTLEKTVRLLPDRVREEAQFVVVDNASTDNSVQVAQNLGIPVIRHEQDRGYGGSNKTGFDYAMTRDVDFFAILHSDCQYDPSLMDKILAPALSGEADLVLGSRILGGQALAGGMPWWKYVSNRFLTWCENKALGVYLSEYHTGYRIYSMQLLRKIMYREDSDNWIFDSEILFQICHLKFKIKELPIPTTYEGPISSVSFKAGAIYGLSIFKLIIKYLLHKWGIRIQGQFLENK